MEGPGDDAQCLESQGVLAPMPRFDCAREGEVRHSAVCHLSCAFAQWGDEDCTHMSTQTCTHSPTRAHAESRFISTPLQHLY